MLKMISWNVNGIRAAARKGFFNWFRQEAPDILCLQETKASPDQLGDEFLRPASDAQEPYYSYWACAEKKGYSGVAIYSKTKPLSISFMGRKEFDSEGRVLVAEYESFVLINAYFPNSQEGGVRLPYKLAFCKAMQDLCMQLLQNKKNVVLTGDINIAHTAKDLAHPDENEHSAGYLPEERSWLTQFLQTDFVDSLRHFDSSPGLYTWWSYRNIAARERNVGWRVDYFFINKSFVSQLQSAAIHPDVEGSDHCPTSITIQS